MTEENKSTATEENKSTEPKAEEIVKFKDLGLNKNLLDGLDAIGFTKATPIQAQAIPKILEGDDLIAVAQTGTGKTVAFLLPALNNICEKGNEDGFIHTLIITPTRELATQIDHQIDALAYFTGATSATVYGGTDAIAFEQQKKALTKGADIIIATPGKLQSHLNFGYVKVDQLQMLILDEADKMLDMGFMEAIEAIIRHLPKNCQRLLFSATMPTKIRTLAKKILNNPNEISIAISKPAAKILQCAYIVKEREKVRLIENLLTGKKSYKSIIVFASTKSDVKNLTKALVQKKIDAKQIHSGLEQTEREDVLRGFMNKQFQVLIATDIVSRGIDVDDISLVINYNVPGEPEDYVHRIGRTARGEKDGVAITFVNAKDVGRFYRIEQFLEKPVLKLQLPKGFDNSLKYEPNTKPKGNRNYKSKGKKKFYKKK